MNTPGSTEKDELQALRRERRNLLIRNWLNGLFIVLALIAIVGVLYFRAGERGLTISYGIAILAIIVKMVEAIYERPRLLNTNTMHYCPGCSHGVVHKLIAEVVDEMGMAEKSVGVSPVGCGVFAYNYLDIDFQEAAHGRAAAVASGIKRVLPDHLVFTYQGDGDAAGIGTNETLHALNRGEGITIIFINNAIYGMTGGQMAPTTLMGQVTSTSPYGRDAALHGYPLKLGEIAALLDGTAFVTRQSVETMGAIAKAKKAIRKAFDISMQHKGSCLVEIVATCSSGWKLSPVDSNKWMQDNMFSYYPKGDLKDTTKAPKA